MIHRYLFLIFLVLSSAACQESPVGTEVPVPDVQSTITAHAEAIAVSDLDATAVAIEDNAEENGAERKFSCSWPAEASAIPRLANQIRAEHDRALATQKAEWRRVLAEEPDDCTSCRSLNFSKDWTVVADIPGWLSLSADFYMYTGGAHGMSGRESLIWDRKRGEGISGIDMFTSPVALENALGTKLCDALNKKRAKRRGKPVHKSGEDMFSNCPGLDEASIFIGSSNGKYFDRLGVYFGPYIAGPYVEGAYELDFPVTSSVIDAVKPAFVEAFRVQS